MTMHDTQAAYLISLIELQLNRKGYYIRREVQCGNRWLDALAERTEGSAKRSSLPLRFAIEYRVVGSRFSPHTARAVEIESVFWLGAQIDLFWIYLYPSQGVVRVPAILRRVVKSEQSMIVKSIT
jgi:hypothetical protein